MSVPNGDGDQVFAVFLITENSVADAGGWFEKAEDNMANVSPLLVKSPGNRFDDQMGEGDMRSIWIPALEVKIILLDVGFCFLNIEVLF